MHYKCNYTCTCTVMHLFKTKNIYERYVWNVWDIFLTKSFIIEIYLLYKYKIYLTYMYFTDIFQFDKIYLYHSVCKMRFYTRFACGNPHFHTSWCKISYRNVLFHDEKLYRYFVYTALSFWSGTRFSLPIAAKLGPMLKNLKSTFEQI